MRSETGQDPEFERVGRDPGGADDRPKGDAGGDGRGKAEEQCHEPTNRRRRVAVSPGSSDARDGPVFGSDDHGRHDEDL